VITRTAVRHAGAGDDACLDDGVLLAGEGRVRDAEQARPRLEEEEPEQAGGDVERGDDPGREHQVHHDAAERRAQQQARRHSASRHLFRPRRDGRHLERALRRRALPRVADRLHPPGALPCCCVAGSLSVRAEDGQCMQVRSTDVQLSRCGVLTKGGGKRKNEGQVGCMLSFCAYYY
jgi:hypothetical protein